MRMPSDPFNARKTYIISKTITAFENIFYIILNH